jgi:hypothetical protein
MGKKDTITSRISRIVVIIMIVINTETTIKSDM